MRRKLKNQNGETLIEAMVSLLIALLAMLLLTTSIMAAANINKATREADESFAEELKYAEGRKADDEREVVQEELLIEFQSFQDVRVDVEVYGGTESLLISYDEGTVSEP
ncbi:MAG: prepilin-type N-terminal cleavage/methylation domain-containing protein [Agathobacter sp.]|nr:prepilin-type N-terminal cleavage/methylation domain-containing protein [Agathobacter sp.]